MSFLNPFAELFETQRFIHARTLRTTFSKKIWDTYCVFFGSFNILDRKKENVPSHYHLGILDYLTLGIPYFFTFLAVELMREKSAVFKVIFGVLAVALLLPRALCAGLLTLISLPFIGLAQAISSSKSSSLKYIINAYSATVKKSDGTESKINLGALLSSNEISIEEVKEVQQQTIPPLTNMPLGSLQLKFFQSEKRGPVIISMKTDKNGQITTKADKAVFEALTELNIGNIQTDIEYAELEAARRMSH